MPAHADTGHALILQYGDSMIPCLQQPGPDGTWRIEKGASGTQPVQDDAAAGANGAVGGGLPFAPSVQTVADSDPRPDI